MSLWPARAERRVPTLHGAAALPVAVCAVELIGAHLFCAATWSQFSKIGTARGMLESELCLIPKGDTPTSSRFFTAVACGCVAIHPARSALSLDGVFAPHSCEEESSCNL